MVGTSTYSAVAQGDNDRRGDGASTASPTSVSATFSSPSAFLSLSEYAFTPLSMVGSDLSDPEDSDGEIRPKEDSGSDAAASNFECLATSTSPSTSTATDKGRNMAVTRPGIHSRRTPGTSRRPTAGTGASIVSTLVHSLEQLHAAGTGYEPVCSTEIIQHDSGQQIHHSPSVRSHPSSRSSSTSPFSGRSREVWSAGNRRENHQQNPQLAPQHNLASHHHNGQATPESPLSRSSNSPTDVNVDISIKTLQQVARTANPSSCSTPLVRPKPRPLPSIPAPLSRASSVRTVSSASTTVYQPSPDLRSRSGSSVATLEATAEEFTLSSSIEAAIRKAHDELKRSDSRQSSVLRASSGRSESDNEGSALQSLQTQLAALSRHTSRQTSRQNSILGTNSAARLGGYSPGGFVMSPPQSISNGPTRYRSVSKTSSLGVPNGIGIMDDIDLSEASNAERFPSFLSRHGPGKSSVRSAMSSKLSLVDIAEKEAPMTLTLEALDEADRAVEAGDESEDEDTIRALAYQPVEGDHDHFQAAHDSEAPQDEMLEPRLDHDFMAFSAPGLLQLHEPDNYEQYKSHEQELIRPASAGSGTTYERNAFGDFDGVHCDPDGVAEPSEAGAPPPVQKRMSRPLSSFPPRPQSYFDMETGQQMLFYPARVPAMLNLPPKLSKNRKPDRAKVRSQVLSVMPREATDSRIWLADPLAGQSPGEPLMSGAVNANLPPAQESPRRASFVADPDHGSVYGTPLGEVTTATMSPNPQREIRRPQRLTASDKRKSKMLGTEELPSHLRASVFFDLPEEPPKIVVKDHSAMATLDSILDASAAAPVTAFTDHSFAGQLGSEVYGLEKKKKKRQSKAEFGLVEQKRSSTSLAALQVHEPKKRASFLSLLARGKSSDNLIADRRSTSLGIGEDGLSPSAQGSSKDGNSPNADQGPFSPNLMDPDSDEDPDKEDNKAEDDEDEDSEEEDLEALYQGRPTTLLAELQIRKQRNRLRTRPVHKVYPNGLHSTLLELDTVAEMERSMRKGKRINLAWEDPAANRDLMEEEDDEEVPLAMLAAARAAAAAKGVNKSALDISTVMDEVNRPLGLMERREMEENEPLSRRRDRIQGRAPRETLNLETMQKRMTQLSLAHGGAGLRSQSRLALPLHSPSHNPNGSQLSLRTSSPQPEPEVEGETLAERRKRLQGNTLPSARPVSGAFSLELLEHFGDPSQEGKGAAPGGEHDAEETLGQRRRRLQGEREARDREMMSGNRVSRRMSMADILAAHPFDTPQGATDPREQERRRLDAVAAGKQRATDAKVAAARAQMPRGLGQPGAGAAAAGGRDLAYRSGVPPLHRMSTMPAGYGGAVQPMMGGQGHGYGHGGAMTMTGVVGDGPYGAAAPAQRSYNAYGEPVPQGPGGVDMVEAWRRSIRP